MVQGCPARLPAAWRCTAAQGSPATTVHPRFGSLPGFAGKDAPYFLTSHPQVLTTFPLCRPVSSRTITSTMLWILGAGGFACAAADVLFVSCFSLAWAPASGVCRNHSWELPTWSRDDARKGKGWKGKLCRGLLLASALRVQLRCLTKTMTELPFAKIITCDFPCCARGWGPQGRRRLPLFLYKDTALRLMNAGFTHGCLPPGCSTTLWPAQEMQLVSCSELGSASLAEELVHLPIAPAPASWAPPGKFSSVDEKCLPRGWVALTTLLCGGKAARPSSSSRSSTPACPLAGMQDACQGEGNGYDTTRWKMRVHVCIARTLFPNSEVWIEKEFPSTKLPQWGEARGGHLHPQHSVSAGAGRLLAWAN